MADTEKIIKIIFEGTDSVTGTASKIRSSLIDNVQKPLADIGQSIIDFDKKLALLAAGGLSYAFYEAVQLESAVVGLDKVLSEEEQKLLPDLVKRMEEFGGAFGQTTAEAVNSAAEFRKASFELEASAHLAELASKLVIGAGESNFQMGRATSTLTALLKGFRVEQENVVGASTHMADVLNKLADEYATTVGELSNGLTVLAPIAEGLGFSFDEMAGFLIPVLEVFPRGAEAANGVKTSFLSLSDTTGEVRKKFEELGISLVDSAGKQKDVKQILNDLLPVYKNLDRAQQVQLATTIAGKDQAGKFSALLNGMATALEATATASGKVGGSLDNELARGLGTAEVQIKRAIAAFRDLAAAVGTEFKDSGKSVIEGSTEISLALKQLVKDGAFDEILNLIENIGNEIGDLFKDIANNLSEAFKDVDLSGLVESLTELKDTFVDTFNIDLSTTEGLTDAIQLVVGAFESLVNVTTGIYNAFKPYIEGVIESIQRSDELTASQEKAFGKIVGVASMIGELGIAFVAFVSGLNQAGVSIQGTFDIIAGSAKAFANTWQLYLDLVLGFMLFFVDKFISAAELLDKVQPFDGVSEKIKSARVAVDELRDANVFSIKENFKEATDGANQALDGFGNKLGETKGKIENFASQKIEIEIDYDKILERAKFAFEQEELVANLKIDENKAIKEIENIARLARAVDFEGIKLDIEIEEKSIDLANEKLRYTTDLMIFLSDESTLDLSPAQKNLENFNDELNVINGTLESLQGRKAEIEFQINAKGGRETPKPLRDELEIVKKQISTLEGKKIQVQLDMEPARREVAETTRDFEQFKDDIKVSNENGSLRIEWTGDIVNEETVEEKKDKLSEDRKFVLEIETKKFESETERIIKKIEADAALAEVALTLRAEIETKKIESDLEKFKTAVESTSSVVAELGGSISSLFSDFNTDLDLRGVWAWRDAVRQQLTIQREQADLQKELIEGQIKLNNLKYDMFRSNATKEIKVSMDERVNVVGKAFLKLLIEAVQAEANLEGYEALLGAE